MTKQAKEEVDVFSEVTSFELELSMNRLFGRDSLVKWFRSILVMHKHGPSIELEITVVSERLKPTLFCFFRFVDLWNERLLSTEENSSRSHPFNKFR